MTTKSSPRESEMLRQVRIWRKEAYEADRSRSPEEREKERNEILRRFGIAEPKGEKAAE